MSRVYSLISITLALLGITILVNLYSLSTTTQRSSITTQDNSNILGTSTDVFNLKVLTIGVNPEEDEETLVEKFFGNHEQIEEATFDRAVEAFERLSDGKIQYEIVHHLNIDTFPLLPNGQPVFNMDTYAPCAGGATPEQAAYCDERKWQFSYTKFFDDYNICDVASMYDVDEIWMLTPPFIGKWESLFVGPINAYFINGGNEINLNCEKLYPVMGPTYDRPENLLHNFSHRIESNIVYLFSNIIASESNNYWRRFIGFDGQPLGCGNGHFPKNFRFDYDYGNPTPAVSICPDWANFPNFNGATTNVGCAAWGCDDPGWQEYWFGFIPANSGQTILHNGSNEPLLIENNWWTYLLNPYESINFVQYSSDPGEVNTTCQSFTYSEWGSCLGGIESRTVLTSNPYGCTGGTPNLTRSCGVPPVSHKNKGDFNNDSIINLSDLSILATYWGQNSSVADANNDGVVNISDLSILASYWLSNFN